MRLPRTALLPRVTYARHARLCIIATEGEKTEKHYFDGFNCSRVKVQVLDAGTTGRSSPEWVLDRLVSFERTYDLAPDDARWLVLDVDRWPLPVLKQVCREARQKGYRLGISNPCFEIFLYLHFFEPDFDCPEFAECLAAEKDHRSAAMERWLRTRLGELGGYSKSRIDFERFRPGIPDAIRRARALDHPSGRQPWPDFPGTRVHHLVEQLSELLS